jgi:acyl carrier protein
VKEDVMTVQERVRQRLAQAVKQPLERVTDGVALADLVVESFALVELAIELQEDFSVRLMQEDLKRVRTVGDLAELIAARAA